MAGAASSFQTWLSEPRNRLIAIVGAVVVLLIIIVLAVVMMTSRGGGAGSSAGGGGFTPPPSLAPSDGTSGGGSTGLSAGATGGGSGAAGSGSGGGSATTTGAGGPGEPTKMARGGPVPSRGDPFQYNPELKSLYGAQRPLYQEPAVVPPGHLEQWYELYKPPHGTGSGGEELAPTEPVPPMRVAGIHNGNVVSAILEVNGQIQPPVVPGQVVDREFRVDEIERDRVVLSRKVPGYKIRQKIEVGMEGPSSLAGGGMRPMPGMMPGMSGGGMSGGPGASGFPGRPYGGKLGGVGGGVE